MNRIKTSFAFIVSMICVFILGVLFLNNETISRNTISTSVTNKYLPSRYFIYEEKEIMIENNIKEEKTKEQTNNLLSTNTIIDNTKETNKIEDNKEKTPLEVETITTKEENTMVIETLVGKLSGYGPDCYGCTSNRTSSGYYVGDGNIYYEDPTYGKVRILAGDSKYPYHTIVKFQANNISSEPIIGIILDRGSAIGIGEKYLFDLLYVSEREASVFGVSKNVTFEILRVGK